MIKQLLFILVFSIVSFSETTQAISITKLFSSVQPFNDSVTYNIVTFEYITDQEEPSSSEDLTDNPSIKIAIVTTSNVLVDVIWEYQPVSSFANISDIVQSIESIDLNHDGSLDFIINYIDVDSEFPDQIISSFLIGSNGNFQEISETFIKDRYEITENLHIKYETPLSCGRPYIDEENIKETKFWVDFYEFQNQKIALSTKIPFIF